MKIDTNVLAEKEICNAVLIRGFAAFDEATVLGLKSEHFQDPRYRLTYKSIEALIIEGKEPDEVVIVEKLTNEHQVNSETAIKWMAETDHETSAMAFPEWVRSVINEFHARTLARSLLAISKDVSKTKSVGNAVSETDNVLSQIAEFSRKPTFHVAEKGKFLKAI